MAFLLLTACQNQKKESSEAKAQDTYAWKTKTENGYTYKYVENDPSHARFYTLDNGLAVILSPSHEKPRIQTYIAVKAGSKTDPADHTGLAHYLEHMLFKGTDKFGSLDWDKEKPLLEKIQALYEQYNSTTDKAEREAIYKKIDEVSGEAAHYAIANEYDKMMAAMGAKGTNAFTSFEQTVYTEDVPSNVIDKFLAVQAERFSHPVFRLFHTELEAVYEEKNRSLDSDGSKVFQTLFKLLFPHNNYGKQTTIGTIEDLKNPSLVEIRKYFNTYYVPNNMGIIMAGDFDPDQVIAKIDSAFSYMKPKEVPPYTFKPETEITAPITAEVFGPEPARLMLGYRFPKASSDDARMLTLVGEILTNGSAGLIDLNLVKQQKLLGAYAFPYLLKDYSVLLLGGNPTQGQDLDKVKSLLLGQIAKLKSGDFSDDLITSIINNEKKSVLERNEKYGRRASALMDNFTLDGDWLRQVNYVDWLGTITKQDIIDFAKKYFHDNYVAVYKRQGEDKNVVKVEKPHITPVDVNRTAQSDFLKKVEAMPEQKIQPKWLDFKNDIQRASTGDYEVLGVENKDNGLFTLDYYYETGSWANKLLPLAVDYLDYVGTKEKSAEDFSKAFYKLASSYYVGSSSRSTYISLSGLQENFKETVKLFDDLLEHSIADEEALKNYIKGLKKQRENAKKNKGQIARALRSYALYGAENPFNNVLTDEELDSLTAQDLVTVLHDLAAYKHKVIYYGPKSAEAIAAVLKPIHQAPEEFKLLPEPVEFKQQSQTENKVLMAYYDMVQAEVFWVRNNEVYSEDLVPTIAFFNQYFGSGMESVVFQTIRESQALAYSTYAFYSNPSRPDERTRFLAYVGTQSDKFSDAVKAMNTILTTLPKSEKSVNTAKVGLRKQLASQRITGQSIIYSYLSAQRMGRNFDIRQKVYDEVENMDFEAIQNFFSKHVSHKPYTYCLVVGEGRIDESELKAIGPHKVIDLETLFGY